MLSSIVIAALIVSVICTIVLLSCVIVSGGISRREEACSLFGQGDFSAIDDDVSVTAL